MKLLYKPLVLLAIFAAFLFGPAYGQKKQAKKSRFNSYTGLIMAGYQGWFNAEGDGAGRGWNHYRKDNKFEPGYTSVEAWPDMTEYTQKYKTAFVHADGRPAYVFSSYDESTVDLHFKWMQQYGIDGVFMQRFVVTLKDAKGLAHTKKVFGAAVKAAREHDRALAVMYDLSGMRPEDYAVVINDWKQLVDEYHFKDRKANGNYLFHRKKPLVAIWGVGFNDGRRYGLDEAEKLIGFFKNDPQYGGCSLLLGVPTYWRDLSNDTQPDARLHTLIRQADIVHPWFVGRYNEETYPKFQARIVDDLAWCRKHKLDYVPTVYPGFSWQNLKPGAPFDAIPRNKGSFLWKQLAGALEAKASMVYVAMFDEIDEATAIFKCTQDVPVGASRFLPYEKEIPNDHYMWLVGQAAAMLKKQIPFQKSMPVRNN
jgi:glycoprotein endo-alpha-1,2-mannosidase